MKRTRSALSNPFFSPRDFSRVCARVYSHPPRAYPTPATSDHPLAVSSYHRHLFRSPFSPIDFADFLPPSSPGTKRTDPNFAIPRAFIYSSPPSSRASSPITIRWRFIPPPSAPDFGPYIRKYDSYTSRLATVNRTECNSCSCVFLYETPKKFVTRIEPRDLHPRRFNVIVRRFNPRHDNPVRRDREINLRWIDLVSIYISFILILADPCLSFGHPRDGERGIVISRWKRSAGKFRGWVARSGMEQAAELSHRYRMRGIDLLLVLSSRSFARSKITLERVRSRPLVRRARARAASPRLYVANLFPARSGLPRN